jgi:pyrroline-5-carboxylate reductase
MTSTPSPANAAPATASQALRITLIGVGNLGSALAEGLAAAPGVALTLCARREESLSAWSQRARTTTDAGVAVADADMVLLVLKPRHTPALLTQLAPALPAGCLVVSCAASLSLPALQRALDQARAPVAAGVRLAVAMPNIGAAVGASTTALVVPPGPAHHSDAALLARVFGTVGETALLADESAMAAVTVTASSGPAFLLLAVEAMADAAVAAGLPRATALTMARGALWAASERLPPGAEPAPVRHTVTSPGGITAAGIAALEAHGVRAAFAGATTAALQRARTMATELEPSLEAPKQD